MIINDLICLVLAGKRSAARRVLVRQWATGLCVAAAAASLGVVTGVLIAPKSGEETRAGLRKSVAKSAGAIEKAVLEKADKKAEDK